MSRKLAVLGALVFLLPTALAHEEEEHDEPAAALDPLHFYRELPWYTVIDDFWIFGEAEKHLVQADLPESAYRGEWELDADGPWVVWIDQTRPGGDVYAYNVDAYAGLYLTEDDFQQHNPVVRDGIVAWEDYRDGQSEIYYFDLEQGSKAVRATNSTATQRRPTIGDAWIAYEDRSDLSQGTDIWIHRLADGTNEPLVQMPGDQTAPAFAGDHVVFRDALHQQHDIMAVRVPGGTPYYITRDTDLETDPVSSGSFAFFLDADGRHWRLLAFDGLRNRTLSTGFQYDHAPRVDVSGPFAGHLAYHNAGRHWLHFANLENGKTLRMGGQVPSKGGPVWADDRVLVMITADEEKGREAGLLVARPSPFAAHIAPRLRIEGPPDDAPFTYPSFTANGTFRTNPVWGDPIGMEYRFGGNWTAFDATWPDWEVQVEVPGPLQVGDRLRLEVRAIFPDAPPIADRTEVRFVRIVPDVQIRELPAVPLTVKLKEMLGAIVLGSVAVVLAALLVARLVLRGTVKRLLVRRVKAEYVRDEPPAPKPARR